MMRVKQKSNKNSDDFSSKGAPIESTAKIDILVKMFWSIEAELEAIADEIPSGDNDVDAMIERELNLYAEKEEIIQTLKATTIANENDKKAVSEVLAQESVSIISAAQSPASVNPTAGF